MQRNGSSYFTFWKQSNFFRSAFVCMREPVKARIRRPQNWSPYSAKASVQLKLYPLVVHCSWCCQIRNWLRSCWVLAGGRTRSSNTQPTKAWSSSESGAVSVAAWWCTNAPTSRGDSPGTNGAAGYGTITGSMQGTVASDTRRNDVPGSVCKPGWS